MARPNISGPKAISWLWDRYEAQKKEIKQLRRDKETYRQLAEKFGRTLQGLQASIETADPYAPLWREKS